MGIQFYPIAAPDSGPMLRCTCPELGPDATADEIDLVSANPCPACQITLDCNEANGRDLLRWLGLPSAPGKCIKATQLVAICEASVPLPDEDRGTSGVDVSHRVYLGGKREGGLATRVRKLLEIARAAGRHYVTWT